MSKPYTVDELLMAIWEDNLPHFQFINEMTGGDCDCYIHTSLGLIESYL